MIDKPSHFRDGKKILFSRPLPLTSFGIYLILIAIRMSHYSTREAAQRLGVTHISLRRYIAAKKIPMPPVVTVGGVRVRLWSDSDIARVREVLPTIKNGRKTRYQKGNPKRKKQPPKKRR